MNRTMKLRRGDGPKALVREVVWQAQRVKIRESDWCQTSCKRGCAGAAKRRQTKVYGIQ